MKKYLIDGLEIYSNYKPRNKVKDWINDNYDFIIQVSTVVALLYAVDTIINNLLF